MSSSTSSSTIKMIVFAYILMILLSSSRVIDAKIGVNWGRLSPTRLSPSMVVDVLMQNRVQEAKIYSAEDEIIEAFSGSHIGLSIGIEVPSFVNSTQWAREFIKKKIAAFPNVKIRYVIIGALPALSMARMFSQPFDQILQSVKIMQDALNEAGYRDIKAVIANSFSGVLYNNITKPSQAEFQMDIKDTMIKILNIYKKNNSPFLIDFFPIAYTHFFGIDENFGFCDNKSTLVIQDINGLKYNNVLDFVFDSFVWAMEKLNYKKIQVIVSQIGWPTDGFPGANVTSAERFYKSLLPYVASNKGTPKRPGEPIDIYIHSLTDEKLNPSNVPFSRHWGIYMSNGQPKYKIDLSGQGRDIYPSMAKGIARMPSRWCVFNGNVSDTPKVMNQFAYACTNADCTALGPGGSCSMLSFRENVSYAFNMYFQFNFQNESKCGFGGLGQLSVDDPSRDGCIFPVEVVKGVQRSDQEGHASEGNKLRVDVVQKSLVALFLVLVLTFFSLQPSNDLNVLSLS